MDQDPVREASLAEAVLERPGCSLTYRRRDSASGRWVVFLHGAGMDGRMFDAQLPCVPAETGIVVWDARGHGGSQLVGRFRYGDMVDDLRALVQETAPQHLTVVGQSMGGNLAQSYVDVHPDAVQQLVLIDCTDNHGPLTRTQRWALRMTGPLLSAYPWFLTVRQSAKACGRDAATVSYAARCLERIGKARFVEVMGFWGDCLTPDPVYRFPCPTKALVGEQDTTGNIAIAMRRLSSRDSNVDLTVVPDAAHNSNTDQPAVVNAILTELLTR